MCNIRWMMHGILPLGQGLQSVHHRAIVSVGRREQEQGEETEVELEQIRLLIPLEAILRKDRSKGRANALFGQCFGHFNWQNRYLDLTRRFESGFEMKSQKG